MRTTRYGIGAVAGAAVMALSATAYAQTTDDSPPLPNVLLMIDTSGSMEYDVNGDPPAAGACDVNPASNTYSSRWMELTQVLAGTVPNLGCYAHDRESQDFIDEFTVETVTPYDQGYFLDYHRSVSNGCVYGSGSYLPNDMLNWDLGNGPFFLRDTTAHNSSCGASFIQQRDGIIDTYRDRVRFGLFTFDARPDDGNGFNTGGPPMMINATTGMEGHWSYYDGWYAGSASTNTGNPPDCDPGLVNSIHEVGARNPAAPPWEGRMINHGPVFATLQDVRDHNDRLQDVLMALRPYGATPLAGMFSDAVHFIRQDQTLDGFYAGENFAPAMDELLNSNVDTAGDPSNAMGNSSCRKQYIILLSDGEPNLDMRPFCEDTSAVMGCPSMPPYPVGCPPIDGACPYSEPWEYAADLYNATTSNVLGTGYTPPVETFVIGFGVDTALSGTVDCETINANGNFDDNGVCTDANKAADPDLAACCELAHIAHAGNTGNARFATNRLNLMNELAAILDSIIVPPSSRTVPSFINASARASGVNADAVSYEFTSAFVAEPGNVWQGGLERKRWVCTGSPVAPVLQDVDPAEGDDFHNNLHSSPTPAASRQFITAVPPTFIPTGFIEPTNSIRATAGLGDGVGDYGSGGLSGDTLMTAAGTASLANANPQAMGALAAGNLPAACDADHLNITSPSLCAQAIMEWNIGITTGPGSRVESQTLLGAIYHSSPRVIGPPAALTSDPSYAVFQANDACSGHCADDPLTGCGTCSAPASPFLQGPRPLTMYVATVDGQLHAFKVASSDPTDTAAVADDTNNEMWSFMPPAALPRIASMYPGTPQVLLDGKITIRDIPLERSLNEAETSTVQYRTVLVASGGQGGGYYFALDVTRPEQPKFLWQLAKDATGMENLFGDEAGEPAIALIPYDDGVNPVVEVAVAILPGGWGNAGVAGGCARKATEDHIDRLGNAPEYDIRTSVRCWQDDMALSATVVRISDGKVLRSFWKTNATGPASMTSAGVVEVTNAHIDEPLLAAVAYPNSTGQVANRAYLTGQDGGLYRIDFSDPDPTAWTLDIAWDSYPFTSGVDNAENGQPMVALPSISIDERGNTVLVFSTGDQEDFRANDTYNRIWSITEYPSQATGSSRNYQIGSNWALSRHTVNNATTGFSVTEQGMAPGEKVAGPIAIFNGVAYFSTLAPPAGNQQCLVGQGRVWAVELQPGASNKTVVAGWPNGDYKIELPLGANPFGVAVATEPSCRTDTVTSDNYVGNHRVATNQARANYVLRFFTGAGDCLAPPCNNATNANTVNITSIDIPNPPTTVTLDSWAAIVE